MSGLNATVADAEFVHGTNPQYLIEKITRQKIYDSVYWKEHCFGLNEETLLEKAVELGYIGGVYGPLSKPTKFLCLVLKLLQLQLGALPLWLSDMFPLVLWTHYIKQLMHRWLSTML